MPSDTENDQPPGRRSSRHHRPRTGRHAKISKTGPLVGGVVAGLALTGISVAAWNATAAANAFADGGPKATTVASPVLAGDAQRRAGTDTAASRSHSRTIPPAGSPQSTSAAPANPTGTIAPPNPAAPALSKPAPVARLSQSQMDNAITIVEAGKQMNLPRRAFVVAIATALQESNLRILANPAVPGSTNHPNEGVGYDHDSIGLFQQRPNWGNVDQLMDPLESARRFYAKLITIPSWEQLAITAAAQAVQSSAFPGAYAQHQSRAEQIVAAISP